MIAGGCLHQVLSHQYSAALTKHKREKKTQTYKNGWKKDSWTESQYHQCFKNPGCKNLFALTGTLHSQTTWDKQIVCLFCLLCIISFSAHKCIHIVHWWNLLCCLVYSITCFLKYELGQALYFFNNTSSASID